MNARFDKLIETLGAMESAVVAFSGGVDSTFLLAATVEALGQKALAVIGRSPTYPARELAEARRLAEEIGARYEIVDTDEMANPSFSSNPTSRCYHCKTTLFTAAKKIAAKEGMAVVLEGSNADDTGDYRPGMQAARELGVRAPLLELGFTKDEIRAESKRMGLSTWDKPAFACLSSRIPYGQAITTEKLGRIERAEEAIRSLGIKQLRVRDHDTVARVEVSPEEIPRLAEPALRDRLVASLKEAGYKYVCLDLEGYRTGAMNEVLGDDEDGR